MTESGSRRGTGLTADALRSTLPGREDAPLAVTLVRLLAHGEPVTIAALAQATTRSPEGVAAQVGRWPNVERDENAAVVGFSGLTLRPTAHVFEVEGRRLHTWCAWDTLFLPAMLDTTAHVRSTCAVTGAEVELVVTPAAVKHAEPQRLHVSFPSLAATDTANITGSFCCHVHFLAGDGAAQAWRNVHPAGEVLDLQAAFALGCGTVAPITAREAATECC